MLNKLIVSCIVLFGLFQAINSQVSRCYSCQSCAVPFTSTSANISSCAVAGLNMSCMTTSIKVPFFSSINKNCAPTMMCQPQNMGYLGYGFFIDCCTTDLCNSAKTIMQSHFISIISITIACLLIFFRNSS